MPSRDATTVGALMALSCQLLAHAEDPAAFAEHMAESWARIAESEKLKRRQGPARTPSGMMRAVSDALKEGKEP